LPLQYGDTPTTPDEEDTDESRSALIAKGEGKNTTRPTELTNDSAEPQRHKKRNVCACADTPRRRNTANDLTVCNNADVKVTATGSITLHRKLQKFGSLLHRDDSLSMPENDGAVLTNDRTLNVTHTPCVCLFLVALGLRVAFGWIRCRSRNSEGRAARQCNGEDGICAAWRHGRVLTAVRCCLFGVQLRSSRLPFPLPVCPLSVPPFPSRRRGGS
jgi:hypothetical protein